MVFSSLLYFCEDKVSDIQRWTDAWLVCKDNDCIGVGGGDLLNRLSCFFIDSLDV